MELKVTDKHLLDLYDDIRNTLDHVTDLHFYQFQSFDELKFYGFFRANMRVSAFMLRKLCEDRNLNKQLDDIDHKFGLL